MFWNKISPVYDLFENVYNRKVYKGTGIKVAEFIDKNDSVLVANSPRYKREPSQLLASHLEVSHISNSKISITLLNCQ